MFVLIAGLLTSACSTVFLGVPDTDSPDAYAQRLVDESRAEPPFPPRGVDLHDRKVGERLRALIIESNGLFGRDHSELIDFKEAILGPTFDWRIDPVDKAQVHRELCIVTAHLVGLPSVIRLSTVGVEPAFAGNCRFAPAYSLLRCGNVKEAAELGETVGDPYLHSLLLVHLARASRLRNDNESSARAIRAAIPLIRKLELLFEQYQMMAWAASELSQSGKADDAGRLFAEAALNAMKEEEISRDSALANVAESEAWAARFADAVSTTQKMKMKDRDYGFSLIAENAAKAGRFGIATSLVAQIQSPLWKAVTDGRIARVFLARGDRAHAWALLNEAASLVQNADGCAVYRELLDARIDLGDFKTIEPWFVKAFWLVDKEPNPAQRHTEYRRFAKRWYRVPGHVSDGRKTFDRALLALEGRVDFVIDAFHDKSIWRDAARQVVGEAALEVGDTQYAAKLADHMTDPDSAPDLRAALAEKMAENGDVRGALRQWRLATESATTGFVSKEFYVDKATLMLVQGLTRSNHINLARTLVRKIKGAHWQALAVYLVAKAAAKTAADDAVVKWVKQQPKGIVRALGLLGFVEGEMTVFGICGHQYLHTVEAYGPPDRADADRRLELGP